MRYAIPFAICLLLCACNTPTNPVTYRARNIELTFEGPLFSGSNTGQASFSPDIQPLLDSLGKTREDISHVKLVRAEFTGDSSAVANTESLVLQFASESASMVQAAVLNPLVPNAPIVLMPSQEADLATLFREQEIIAVLDADLFNDADTSYYFSGNFTFQIEVK